VERFNELQFASAMDMPTPTIQKVKSWEFTSSGVRSDSDSERLWLLEVSHREVVLQSGKNTLCAVWHMAVYLKLDSEGRMAATIKPRVGKRTQYHCIQVAALSRGIYQMQAKLPEQTQRSHRGVNCKALPHTTGFMVKPQQIKLAGQADMGGDSDATHASPIPQRYQYMRTSVVLVFRPVEIGQTQLGTKTPFTQLIVLLQYLNIASDSKLQ
jgi:hypothetical protein